MIQQASQNYICVMEDVFRLNPPRTAGVARHDSAIIFQNFLKYSNLRWPLESQQGLYVMTPEGGYLYGRFAAHTNIEARDVMIRGWRAWQYHSQSKQSKKIPTAIPARSVDQERRGHLKLRTTYRDLPRGTTEIKSDYYTNTFNLGWYSITESDARSLAKGHKTTWQRLVLSTMKDAVRGQMPAWSSRDWRSGHFSVTAIESDDESISKFRVQSNAVVSNSRIYYAPTIFGELTFDSDTQKCVDLQLLAVGQRGGQGGHNGRRNDAGYAPMAVAIRLMP